MHRYSFVFALAVVSLISSACAQTQPIPSVYSNIRQDDSGQLYFEHEGERYNEVPTKATYALQDFETAVSGNANGLTFSFPENLNGTLYYGFIKYGDGKHALPVYFKKPAAIEQGKAQVDITKLKGKYDMIGWEASGTGTIGYRVVNEDGLILYDGKVTFAGTGPFQVAPTLIEGPFVNQVTASSVVITYRTNQPIQSLVTVDGKRSVSDEPTQNHEVFIDGLEPGTDYPYTVTLDQNTFSFSLRTAPAAGSREPFTFAYASDSRNGQGGGERNVYGTNFYIVKKIAALATQQNAAFFQFSGDLINGYLQHPDEMNLQYVNWKRAVEPFWHYLPFYVSMGNHEALMRVFENESGKKVSVDRFPFATESAERVFQQHFSQAENGPLSEDGAAYDPNPEAFDFPSYKENVFYYTYDNTAVIVLNSDYWYAPSLRYNPHTSGGLHAYIMDRQLQWLQETLQTLEADKDIDHIFVTQHTPFFPNGGHVKDDMWYNGDNEYRTWVAGKPLEKGILERRDQLLDLLVNQSEKVVAILTGDEHNFAYTEVGPNTSIYPEDYPQEKRISLSRTIYQVNNGAAGAPYYAQEQTPWTPQVSGFTTQNALVLFDITGGKVHMRVINPDTLEEFDQLELR